MCRLLAVGWGQVITPNKRGSLFAIHQFSSDMRNTRGLIAS